MSNEYLDIAMEKIIKQEVNKVLDKIRAEIIAKHLKNIEHDDYSNGYSAALEEILSVIDKYKAESEPQESEKYCDRNICVSNEYNGIGCDECEVTKSQEPCENAISRQAVNILVDELARAISDERCCMSRGRSTATIMQDILDLPPVKPQEETEQFAKWVATEIFDDMWEYNKDAFAEIACRKLAKLGIVRAKCDEWELIEEQESEK